MKLLESFLLVSFFAAFFAACSASGGEETFAPKFPDENEGTAKSSGSNGSSGSADPESSSGAVEDSTLAWVTIPATAIIRGTATYSISSFEITTTEVTRGLYTKVMGDIPQQANEGADFPVEYVNWYQAVLFCNAYSKLLGRDTAYVYTSVGDESYLKDLSIDYSAKGAVRLPTESEWEVAARGGTASTYYWGTEEAKNYAYYGQSKGPVAVAQYLSNEYGLYDMAGNVAEWVNDWYGSYENKDIADPTGAETGTTRVVRGGGFQEAIKDCAPSKRDNKAPLYKSHTLGFRIARSVK
ncbi:MAG: SUMF1/EgtB/PvdO family nonheme iron enzyme [Fibrobacter sp.]|nr:SUMF1/EgtB/PvdO family nonheme iron enzyme [Fibrobacter sp.]